MKPQGEEDDADGIDWHDFIVVEAIDLYDDEPEKTDTSAAQNEQLQKMNNMIESQTDYVNNQNKMNFENKT